MVYLRKKRNLLTYFCRISYWWPTKEFEYHRYFMNMNSEHWTANIRWTIADFFIPFYHLYKRSAILPILLFTKYFIWFFFYIFHFFVCPIRRSTVISIFITLYVECWMLWVLFLFHSAVGFSSIPCDSFLLLLLHFFLLREMLLFAIGKIFSAIYRNISFQELNWHRDEWMHINRFQTIQWQNGKYCAKNWNDCQSNKMKW